MNRALAGIFAAVFIASGSTASAQGTLRIGMTASDIPLTTGQTDNGGEGMPFMGYTVYDALINWDLSSANKPSALLPRRAATLGRAPVGHRSVERGQVRGARASRAGSLQRGSGQAARTHPRAAGAGAARLVASPRGWLPLGAGRMDRDAAARCPPVAGVRPHGGY